MKPFHFWKHIGGIPAIVYMCHGETAYSVFYMDGEWKGWLVTSLETPDANPMTGMRIPDVEGLKACIAAEIIRELEHYIRPTGTR